MGNNTPFIQYITSEIVPQDTCFRVVDVGASGGIDPLWSAFGEHLDAVGFDPLTKECERLNRLVRTGKTKYVSAYVGAPPHVEFPNPETIDNKLWPRLSLVQAIEELKTTPNEHYNSFQEMIFSQDHITLDDYFVESDQAIDFLKIDTDGHDIKVLYGATRIFSEKTVLGVCVECQFHGSLHPRANTFANIDIFLRERGFSLFDMKIHRYSRRDLPGKFLISIPAQTDTGQIQWADVYYFRDLGDRDYTNKWGGHYNTTDIIKLACLFELHNLQDCAVELLAVHRTRLNDILDVDRALDLLAPPINGKPATVRDYRKRFDLNIAEMRFLQEGDFNRLPADQKARLKEYRRILLFGAGGRLEAALPEITATFHEEANISLTDNDRTKWGETFASHPIIPPADITGYQPDLVLIVSTYAQEILRQVLDLKVANGLHFDLLNY